MPPLNLSMKEVEKLTDASLAAHAWFFGRLSAQEAGAVLKGQPAGSYLVRNSSRAGHYTISFLPKENTLVHVLLEPAAGGGFNATKGGKSIHFKDIPSVLRTYNKHYVYPMKKR